MAVGEIERQGCIEEVVRRGAVGVWIIVVYRLLLALQDTGGSAVVVASADVKLTAEGIDGGRLPDRAAAVAARHAAVVRQGVGLPQEPSGVGIECHHATAECAARIGCTSKREALLER